MQKPCNVARRTLHAAPKRRSVEAAHGTGPEKKSGVNRMNPLIEFCVYLAEWITSTAMQVGLPILVGLVIANEVTKRMERAG